MASGRKKQDSRTGLILLVVAIVGVALAAGVGYLNARATAHRDYLQWTANDHPCPQISKAAFDALHLDSKALNFDGVGLSYVANSVACQDIHDFGLLPGKEVPACQFGNPVYVSVNTGKAQYYYFTSDNGAAVTIDNGVPRCGLRGH